MGGQGIEECRHLPEMPRLPAFQSKGKINMKNPVVYPPIVIVHLAKSITDLVRPKMIGKKSIEIHYSAQMNGHPHLGTITSLGCAFSIGKKLSEEFGIPSKIKFEVLENAPAVKIERNGKIYDKMHCDTYENGKKLSETYLDSFKELMNYFQNKTKIKYELLYYNKFQSLPFVRKKLIEIVKRKKEFIPFIAPTERRLRIRFPCSKCRFAEKTSINTKIKILTQNRMKLDSTCFDHGPYSIEIRQNNKEFVDFNTSIRNVIKEAKFIEDSKKNQSLNLMVDGGDWTGMAFQIMHSLDLMGYLYKEMPVRIFTPIIEDWSGAKFSKSIYVNSSTYNSLPKGLVNYHDFKKDYGKTGLEKVWNEINNWTSESKKLFRNYSIEYMKSVIEGN